MTKQGPKPKYPTTETKVHQIEQKIAEKLKKERKEGNTSSLLGVGVVRRTREARVVLLVKLVDL